MPRLTRADASMFDDIHERLLHPLNPDLPREVWRRIFEHPWTRPENHVGYVLLEDEVPVGFLGLIFSEVPVAGGWERVGNITTWVVQKGHGAAASLLVMALRELDSVTLTNLTSNEQAYQVFRRLGFEVLETHTRVLLPPIGGAGPGADIQISHDPRTIAERLEEPDRRILRDHQSFAHHLLAWNDDAYCYLLFTMGRRWRLPTARVHYVSELDFFLAHRRPVQHALWRVNRAILTEMDERFLRGRQVPTSFRRRLSVPRLFKSPRLTPQQVGSLYSEIPLLNV